MVKNRRVKKYYFGTRWAKVKRPALLLTGRLLDLSKALFPHLENGVNKSKNISLL